MQTHHGGTRRAVARLAIFALVVGTVGLITSVVPAGATTPAFVSQTLEGCRNDGTITLPNGSGKFICPDAAYTTGNLGKGWNELDLVPHRLTVSLGNQGGATTTYDMNVVADNQDGGHPGYDVITVPEVNTAKSDVSCSVSPSAQGTKTPGIGGTDASIYRTLTIHQNKGTTCVIDWAERLALGSHLYPGASLHSNLTQSDFSTGGIGARDVSIPVKEIAPQELDKDMSASQGSDHIWDIVKSPSPAHLSFDNTCDTTPGALSTGVDITVSWTKEAATPSGDITVLTHVYATNPASRIITVNVTDAIRSGTTVLDTANSGDIDVPANTANFLVLTHQTTVPAGTTDLNDVATATYTDKATGIAVPGNTTATASATVTNTGPELNQTATITDSEFLDAAAIAAGLKFSVATPSVGAFTGGYVAGAQTTGPVGWWSGVQTGTGSVTFNKTVYASAGTSASGNLHDDATLTGSDGFTASTSLDVDITVDAVVDVVVSKTIDLVLQSGENVTFTFDLFHQGDDPATATPVDTKTITFTGGANTAQNGTQARTATFGGLTPGSYFVHEHAVSGWGTAADTPVTVALPSCSETVNLSNNHNPASARVKKVTIPAGFESGWEFTLTGPGTPAGGEKVTTSGTDYVNFNTALEEGAYTITETAQAGWDNTGTSGDCSFTVNYPADNDRVFSCTFQNTERGQITVVKTFQGQTPSADQTFSFDLRTGASAGVAGTVVTPPGAVTLSSGNSWTYTWGNLVPGTYQLCESGIPAGGKSSLEDDPASFAPGIDNSTICVPVTLDPNGDVTVNVDNTPPPGGNARTIGYWRNWTSCDGKGHQAPTLDQTLFAAGTISVGNLVLHGGATADVSPDCIKAVRIVSKKRISDGKNMASDPAFGMAAQYLAARLNVVAGAATCPAVITAINNAQTLLLAINFNGNTHDAMTAAQKHHANTLAGTLDSYNNNTLC
jgi:hypothetical protein